MSTIFTNEEHCADKKIELWDILLNFKWYEDIVEALQLNNRTALNKWCLTQELIKKMNELEEFNLSDLWFLHYEIIKDVWDKSIENAKKSWVTYIMSVNDFWDINIQPIDWHINQFRQGYMSIHSFRWRFTLPYVLLYNRRPLTVEAQILASQVSSTIQEIVK